MPKRLRILFICTGNTCRSVIAAGIFEKIWRDLKSKLEIEIESAGMGALEGLGATTEALLVLKEEGIDQCNHRSQLVSQEKIAKAHYVFAMTRRHKEALLHQFPEAAAKVWVLSEFVSGEGAGDIADPYGSSLANYRLVAAEIKEVLKKVALKIEASAMKKGHLKRRGGR